jgi:hypothetical protein
VQGGFLFDSTGLGVHDAPDPLSHHGLEHMVH